VKYIVILPIFSVFGKSFNLQSHFNAIKFVIEGRKVGIGEPKSRHIAIHLIDVVITNYCYQRLEIFRMSLGMVNT